MSILETFTHYEEEKESPNTGVWPGVYDSGTKEVDGCFRGILKKYTSFTTIEQFVAYLRKIGINPVGLDLAGQARVLAEQGMRGVGNCLSFPRWLADENTTGQKHRRGCPDVALVPGDIGLESTWDQIESVLPGKANFIQFTPGAGMILMPDEVDYFATLARRMADIADPDYALILGQMPWSVREAFEELLPEVVDPLMSATYKWGVPQFAVWSAESN